MEINREVIENHKEDENSREVIENYREVRREQQ
jgi:hypothetical protein